ncbi:MAG: YicC family protein [Gemmatimonas sp.]|nr:YicC family protein [Gemmatimonas sp.]
MIRSMTGYGEASGTTGAGVLRVELRTVNHRYFNLNSRLPSALGKWENDVREWLRSRIGRGHVNLTARWEASEGSSETSGYRLDEERIQNYLHLFRELSERFNVGGEPDLALLARYNDIIVRADDEEDSVELEVDELRPIVDEAASQVIAMREDEGKRLEADLRGRIDAIEDALDRIAERAPQRLEAERNRLKAAVAALLDGAAPDPDRIAQEIAMLAERWDLNEELVRFRSHDDLFLELLDAASNEPVGKRLAFLVQEMHREANTIGSKANDSPISHLVVAIKDEIERLREQVENVE